MLGTQLTHCIFLAEKKKEKKIENLQKSQSILSEICCLCFLKVFSLFVVKTNSWSGVRNNRTSQQRREIQERRSRDGLSARFPGAGFLSASRTTSAARGHRPPATARGRDLSRAQRLPARPSERRARTPSGARGRTVRAAVRAASRILREPPARPRRGCGGLRRTRAVTCLGLGGAQLQGRLFPSPPIFRICAGETPAIFPLHSTPFPSATVLFALINGPKDGSSREGKFQVYTFEGTDF